MNTFLPTFIDSFLAKHPVLMLICLLALAILSCIILIGSGSQALVYEGF